MQVSSVHMIYITGRYGCLPSRRTVVIGEVVDRLEQNDSLYSMIARPCQSLFFSE